MTRTNAFESLESRRLLTTVSASAFTGSLDAGSKADFDIFSSGKLTSTEVGEVIGPGSFNGHSATRFKSTYTTTSKSVSTDNFYATLSSSLGFISFGESISSSSISENIYFSPEQIEFPASVVPGKTYKSSFIDKTVATVSGHTTTSAFTYIREVKLVSATKTPITVPASKTPYECYEIEEVDYAGTSTPSTLTAWYDPGVALIKSTSGTGGEVELTYVHNV